MAGITGRRPFDIDAIPTVMGDDNASWSSALFVGVGVVFAACGAESAQPSPFDPLGDAGAAKIEAAASMDAESSSTADVASAAETDRPDAASPSSSTDVDSPDRAVADAAANGADGLASSASDAGSLAVCFRLTTARDPDRELVLARLVAEKYMLAIYAHCELRNIDFPSADEYVAWNNRLLAWNRTLWGCLMGPLRGFELVNGEITAVSAQTAERLIAIYLDVATTALELNSKEQAAMREVLVQQSQLAIDVAARDEPLSACESDAAVAVIDEPVGDDARDIDASASWPDGETR